jgi:hypothetical protein
MHDAIAIPVPSLRMLCLPKDGSMLHPCARAPCPTANEEASSGESSPIVADVDAPVIDEEALFAQPGGNFS